jgi:hypothetical protein
MAKILLDHPEARERAAAIAALAGPRPAPPATPSVTPAPGALAGASASAGTAADSGSALLDAAEWTALKRICDGGTPPTAIGK